MQNFFKLKFLEFKKSKIPLKAVAIIIISILFIYLVLKYVIIGGIERGFNP